MPRERESERERERERERKKREKETVRKREIVRERKRFTDTRAHVFHSAFCASAVSRPGLNTTSVY